MWHTGKHVCQSPTRNAPYGRAAICPMTGIGTTVYRQKKSTIFAVHNYISKVYKFNGIKFREMDPNHIFNLGYFLMYLYIFACISKVFLCCYNREFTYKCLTCSCVHVIVWFGYIFLNLVTTWAFKLRPQHAPLDYTCTLILLINLTIVCQCKWTETHSFSTCDQIVNHLGALGTLNM